MSQRSTSGVRATLPAPSGQRSTDAAARPEPVYGITEAAEAVLGTITTNTNDLGDGGLSDLEVTITGFDYKPGGEIQKRDDGTEFESRDQVEMHLRIDNADDLGLENPNTIQYFGLPKLITRDGKQMRAKPTRGSAYGIWLAVLASLGVSSNREEAFEFLMQNGLRDLIGLRYHRMINEYEGFGGRANRVAVPVALFGFDNQARASNGLPAAALRTVGTEQLATTSAADSVIEPDSEPESAPEPEAAGRRR